MKVLTVFKTLFLMVVSLAVSVVVLAAKIVLKLLRKVAVFATLGCLIITLETNLISSGSKSKAYFHSSLHFNPAWSILFCVGLVFLLGWLDRRASKIHVRVFKRA